DALWDDLIRSGDPTRFSDLDTAPFVAYLDVLAPRPNSAARARIRRRVVHAQEQKEEIMERPLPLTHANGHLPSRAPSRRGTRSRPRRHSLWKWPVAAMEVTAAFALIAAIVIGVLTLRPHDGPGPGLPAASTLGSPSATPRASGDGGSIASLELDNTAATSDLFVMIRRVTLPPNTRWDFANDAFPPVPAPVDQYVESGTLTVGFRGQEREVTAGSNFKVEGGIQYLRNARSEPVTFLQVLTHETTKAAPEPPDSATVAQICDLPLPASLPDSWTLVTLNRASFTGAGTPAIPDILNQKTIFMNVESGKVNVYTTNGSAATTLRTGQSFTVAEDNRITKTEIVGDTEVSTLYLNVEWQTNAERVANDPRAGSTSDWQIPDGGANIGLILNQLTLEPSAALSFDLDGVMHLRVITGTIGLTTDDGEKMLSVNERADASGRTHVTIRNTSAQPADVLLGLAYSEGTSTPGITRENRTGVMTITPLGTAVTHLPAGSATVSLAPVQPPSEIGASSSISIHDGASLIAVTQGTIILTRMAGEVEIWHGVPTNDATVAPAGATPSFGKPTELHADDAVFVHPYGGYRLELAADTTNPAPQLFALTVTSTAQSLAATPTAHDATPAPAEAFTVAGDTPCTVAPRTMEDLTAILSPEHATGTPDPGLRDHQANGTPADPDTVAGVRQTVTDLAACQSNGSGWQTYALYSANAIRLMAEANNLTAEDLATEADNAPAPNTTGTSTAGQHGITVAIDDILTFPNGRAGAMVNFDGELAYLTFVHQGDRWLIDAWDDR
ncbi:MAG TPA: hypothetical protein VFL82_02280, partial [Thermomicrobiales bacterium]|nr:hypothetical protein [Thermomicrobiales bacterium]